jgi:hypothetical protein
LSSISLKMSADSSPDRNSDRLFIIGLNLLFCWVRVSYFGDGADGAAEDVHVARHEFLVVALCEASLDPHVDCLLRDAILIEEPRSVYEQSAYEL